MSKNSYSQRGASNLLPFLVALLIIAGTVLITAAIPWMLQNCINVDSSKGLIGTGAGSCLEFWVNRYQALIAAVIAIGTALFAGIPVWNQLQYTQRQVEQQQLEMLRQRGYEMSEEKNALFSVIAKLDVGEQIVNQMVHAAANSVLRYDEYEPGVAQNYDSLGPAIRRFEEWSGRIWGDATFNDLKQMLLNNIYDAATKFGRFHKSLRVRGIQTGWINLEDFVSEGKEYKAAFDAIVSQVQAYVDAIAAESRRLQATISDMEQHLI